MHSLHLSQRYGRWLLGLACLLPAFLVGCGSETLYPVTGKITLGGTPMNAGTVKLWAEDGSSTEAVAASPINSDGTYEILTKGKKGAPPGKYKITVSAGVPPGPGAVLTPVGDPSKTPQVKMAEVPQIYTDDKSTTLKYEVVATPGAGAYDLTLTK